MSRLAATTRLDMTVQARSKLYVIAIGVAVVLGLFVRILIPADLVSYFLPIFYLSAVSGTAYMFVGGMVIFEKDEGTLDAQIVTPLRMDEYLSAKSISLLIVVLMESALVLFIGYGFTGYDPVPLLIGLITLPLGFTLGGFIQVSRYDTVTDFIVYAIPVILVTQLPLLDYTGLAPSLLWYVIPTMGPLLLLKAAFTEIAAWQWVYALIVSVASIFALFWWARHAFQRNIVRKRG